MEKVERIAEILRPLTMVVKDRPSPEVVVITSKILADYPEDAVVSAVRIGLTRFKFWPTPSEIIELMGSKDHDAEKWWNMICNHAKNRGFYAGVPPGLPPEAKRAMENVGDWEAICMCDVEKLPILAKQFRDAYRAFARHAEFQSALPDGSPMKEIGESE